MFLVEGLVRLSIEVKDRAEASVSILRAVSMTGTV